MAFQAGSTIRPELGNADYSGFANAASIQANSLAQLGATIGSAIQVAGEKKKEKALSKQAQEMVFGMLKKDPQQAAFFGLGEDFTVADVKPIVDVIGVKPSIALMMQLNMASMKADTPSLASVKEAQNFKEYLGTIGGGTDVILKNGMLYDEDIFFDDPLPANHPIVQEVLRTKEGQTFLSGYGDAEPLELNKEDETPVVGEPVVEPVRTPAPQVTQPAFPSINRRESDFIPRPF
tara:strand:+ start:116 stop:820 length:705 start_codon:yes stop_codon:yes gene_type:complete